MEIRAKDCMKGMMKGRCRVDQLRAYLPLNESARQVNFFDVSGVRCAHGRPSGYTPAADQKFKDAWTDKDPSATGAMEPSTFGLLIREMPQPIGIATAHTTAMASQSSGGS